uniref:Venom protein n=1 Tax=Steinernema glaseri TaxID=37863 RepID=A0A1I7YVV5_9BILA
MKVFVMILLLAIYSTAENPDCYWTGCFESTCRSGYVQVASEECGYGSVSGQMLTWKYHPAKTYQCCPQ